ncbi:MAG: RimK family alpha-L-glutamate ligase [Candidatus Thorarchaeota archaeon]
MKIGILHHDLEWTEKELKRIIDNLGHTAKTFDVRKTSVDKIKKEDLDIMLNRVYASVGNRDYSSLQKTLEILKELEKDNLLIINSFEATQADYSKYNSFELMTKGEVSTPKTVLYNKNLDLNRIINELNGFPLIVKRDTGGRGKDLAKCDTKAELEKAIQNINNSEDYQGGIIIQEFVNSTEDNDYRIWIIGGKFLFYHERSLISLKEEEKPWLASRSLGSKILKPKREVAADLKEFAEKAAESIKADLDVLDVMKTKEGYLVIEHNPTPNIRPEYEGILGFNVVEYFLKEILNSYRKNIKFPLQKNLD